MPNDKMARTPAPGELSVLCQEGRLCLNGKRPSA